jgi:hypothetical protein
MAAQKRLTALAGAKCLSKRHHLRADRNVVTAQDGSREIHYWCTDQACTRYGQAVAARAL